MLGLLIFKEKWGKALIVGYDIHSFQLSSLEMVPN